MEPLTAIDVTFDGERLMFVYILRPICLILWAFRPLFMLLLLFLSVLGVDWNKN